MKRPTSLYFLFALHLFLVISAVSGGVIMIYKSDGSLLGLEIARLEHTPFPDYQIPGIILLLSNGLFPLFSLIGLIFEPQWKKANVFNIYNNMYWAWTYSLFSGIIVITWITVQLLLTSYYWMHPVVIFIALLIVIFTLMPSTVRYYKSR